MAWPGGMTAALPADAGTACATGDVGLVFSEP
jgi:hypothetical protein